MKKIVLGLFAMMLVVSSVNLVSASGCGHDYINPLLQDEHILEM